MSYLGVQEPNPQQGEYSKKAFAKAHAENKAFFTYPLELKDVVYSVLDCVMIAAIYIENSMPSGLLDAARSEVDERVVQLQNRLDCELVLGNALKYLQLAKDEAETRRAKALQLKRVCQGLKQLYPNGDLDDFLNDFLDKNLPSCAAEDPPLSLNFYCNCDDCEAGITWAVLSRMRARSSSLCRKINF